MTQHDADHGNDHVHTHGHADGHEHDHDHGHHAATHEAERHHHPSPDQSVDSRLLSIGVDIGSATTHFVVSELQIGRRDARLAGKPEVLERKVLHTSPVLITPYSDAHTIDAEALEAFIRGQAVAAGIDLATVHTGAVICTGEASRKDNAAAISEHISRISGDFVCAAAGHHLEAVLGAHGSGAVELCRSLEDPLVLLDVGGGTSKRTVLHDGRILETSAINVGTRLIAFDEDNRVIRAEDAGVDIAREIGIDIEVGAQLLPEQRTAVAEHMAEHLIRFLGLTPSNESSEGLWLTGKPAALPAEFHLGLAGGMSDYYFGHSTLVMGDLGQDLSDVLRARLTASERFEEVFDPGGGIRATVVGAGQFALQVSGETIFMNGGLLPPLRALPVRSVEVPWDDLSEAAVAKAIDTAARPGDQDTTCVLSFGRAPRAGYALARQLAAALAPALEAALPGGKAVLVFQQNIGRTVGEALARAGTDISYLCLDEITVGELDFMDIGRPTDGDGYLPVTVKTLAFGD